MMNKHFMIPALLTITAGLAACATDPNPNLEQARTAYSALQSNPQASTLAALETQDASQWLDKSDKAFREGEDKKTVDQMAYLTSQRVALANETIQLRSAENELKNSAARRAQARLDARDAQIKSLQNSLNAKQTDRGSVVTFGDVLFDYNKSQLKSGAFVNITRLAQFLQSNPDRKVIVEGYTDSTGSASYNQSLSESRATSVMAALVRAGIEPSRIVAQGYGKEYPIADNTSDAGRAQNRRVEVTISNDNQPVVPRGSLR